MDKIIREIKKTAKKVFIGYKNLKKVKIDIGAFADDVMIVAKTPSELQDRLNKWNSTLIQFGMTMNYDITKVMVLGKDTKIQIKIENIIIEHPK